MPMTPEQRTAVDEMIRTNEVTKVARAAIVMDVIELGIRVHRAERSVLGLKLFVAALVAIHLVTWWW